MAQEGTDGPLVNGPGECGLATPQVYNAVDVLTACRNIGTVRIPFLPGVMSASFETTTLRRHRQPFGGARLHA